MLPAAAAPGEPAHVMRWRIGGPEGTQVMASVDDLAAYADAVLPPLVEVGARGAMLWRFADCAATAWDRPPCDEAHHERFLGLLRPDGSLKPHAEAVRACARTRPRVRSAAWPFQRGGTADAYGADPAPPRSGVMALSSRHPLYCRPRPQGHDQEAAMTHVVRRS